MNHVAFVYPAKNSRLKEASMGGGGGYSFSPVDKKELEKKAKEHLRNAVLQQCHTPQKCLELHSQFFSFVLSN